MSLNKRLTITIPNLWLDFMFSISFMQAWLKFQAKSVTQVIGRNIGRLIFAVLNKIELFFMMILLVLSFKIDGFKKERQHSEID